MYKIAASLKWSLLMFIIIMCTVYRAKHCLVIVSAWSDQVGTGSLYSVLFDCPESMGYHLIIIMIMMIAEIASFGDECLGRTFHVLSMICRCMYMIIRQCMTPTCMNQSCYLKYQSNG